MTHLERNGDVVRLASYAPLLAKRGHTQWNPDLIYFDTTRVVPTINYYVQQLFSTNSGDAYLSTSLDGAPEEGLEVSCVRDAHSQDVILKIVNVGAEPRPLDVELKGRGGVQQEAKCLVLTGESMAVNEFDSDAPLVPKESTLDVGNAFKYAAPAHSLSVIRIRE